MTDPSDDDLIDITERGYAVYPRAEEINDSLLEVEFSEGNYPLAVGSEGEYTLVRRVSSEGNPYSTWERVPLPTLMPGSLDCVVYLYRSIAMAKEGENAGGSGFLVTVASDEHAEYEHLYVVTNSHVVCDGYTVVRINTASGKTDEISIPKRAWRHHKEGHDIAVAPVTDLVESDYNLYPVHVSEFLQSDHNATFPFAPVGPGAEVFLLGRFINHEGRQQNAPTIRYGHIAMVADESNKVLQRNRIINGIETDYEQVSFLVELHTIGGYSGSPVFVYFPFWRDSDRRSGKPAIKDFLLGVHWGSIPTREPVLDDKGKEHPAGWQVIYSTGMAGVVPVWYLHDLLMNDEDLQMQRKEQDKRISDKKKTEEKLRAGILQSTKPEPPFSKDRFNDALKRASRKVSEPESKDRETSE